MNGIIVIDDFGLAYKQVDYTMCFLIIMEWKKAYL